MEVLTIMRKKAPVKAIRVKKTELDPDMYNLAIISEDEVFVKCNEHGIPILNKRASGRLRYTLFSVAEHEVVDSGKFITAVMDDINTRRSKVKHGFSFNTDIQCLVERALQLMHYHSYYLCYTDVRPNGVYTNVDIIKESDVLIRTLVIKDTI
jgi:hypothetical protein